MYEDDYSQKIKFISISLIVALVAVIIAVSAISSSLGSSVHIVNYGSGDTGSLLTDKELKSVKEAVLSELRASNVEGADISIRWSSYNEPLSGWKKFLIDIDKIQQTYQVTLASGRVDIDCPKPAQSLYPNSFCITNNGEDNDSIYATFGYLIPYEGATANGTKFRLYRDKIGVLAVHVFDCESEDKKNDVQETIDNLVKSLNANPAIFKYSYYYNNCTKK